MATPATNTELGSSSLSQGTTNNATTEAPPPPLPRITIKFCTQCKWMLRAAYFAQELLSTFSTALGEVALQPSTGGVFIVQIQTESTTAATDGSARLGEPRTLWDRKVDGGFPETKELKRRVRDVVEPGRNLGHVDRDYARPDAANSNTTTHHAAAHVSARASGSTQVRLGKLDPGYGATGNRSSDGTAGVQDKEKCEDCS